MHSSLCSSLPNTSVTSCQMNTLMLAICWKAFNVPMQACKLLWPVSEWTTAQTECATISKRQQLICCHMIRWPRSAPLRTRINVVPPRFHPLSWKRSQSRVKLAPPRCRRRQVSGRRVCTSGTTRWRSMTTCQMNRRIY